MPRSVWFYLDPKEEITKKKGSTPCLPTRAWRNCGRPDCAIEWRLCNHSPTRDFCVVLVCASVNQQLAVLFSRITQILSLQQQQQQQWGKKTVNEKKWSRWNHPKKQKKIGKVLESTTVEIRREERKKKNELDESEEIVTCKTIDQQHRGSISYQLRQRFVFLLYSLCLWSVSVNL